MKTLTQILHEGQAGDWQSEGYQLTDKQNPDGSVYLQATKNGTVVARMEAKISESDPGHGYVDMIKIDPEARRKGLATAMYKRAEEMLGVPFKPSTYQSPEAQGLWNQKDRPFGNK